MPKRIQRRRSKGWRKPEGVVSVTRPGKWGNPHKSIEHASFAKHAYVTYLDKAIADGKLDIEELRGRDLMCWCKVGRPFCHGDVLLDRANR